METCDFCPTLHRSVGQSGGAASGAGAFFKSRRPCGGGPAFPPAGPPCKLIRNEECFLNQTANYQLPLWEKQDRILMEDFNSLTERLDLALQENRENCHFQKLLEHTTASASRSVNISLSGISVRDYREFLFYFDSGGEIGDVVSAYVRCNGIETGYYGESGNEKSHLCSFLLTGTDYPGCVRVEVLLGGAIQGLSNTCYWTERGGSCSSSGGMLPPSVLLPEELRSITLAVLDDDPPIPAKSKILFYGIKA